MRSTQTEGVLGEESNYRSSVRESSILLFGSSFKTSSIGFREALASRLSRDSQTLPRSLGAREYAELVTCNRVEVLVASESPEKTKRAFQSWISRIEGASEGAVYVLKDVDAVAHIFRVASGLDSLVIGEEQVLSQVKAAGKSARRSGSSKASLSALFDASLGVAKRTKQSFKLGGDTLAAAALRSALGRLDCPPKKVLLIGTGKTSLLAAEQLRGAKLFVATRRRSASSVRGATLVPHSQLKRVASDSDLIVSATRHRGYLLKKGDLSPRKRVILDLAFPRNIDPDLDDGETEVWDLERLVKAMPKRPAKRDIVLAEELVSAEAEGFSQWLLASRQSSALSDVYRWAEATRRRETEAALRRLAGLSARDRKVVEALSKRVLSKLLSPPTRFAKGSSPEFPQDQRLDLIKRIFETVADE